MLVDANMMKSHSSSVAPVPTVIPGPTEHYQTAGETGHRTLWYVESTGSEAVTKANQRQGRLHHYGHLIPGLLRTGLQSTCSKLAHTQ